MPSVLGHGFDRTGHREFANLAPRLRERWYPSQPLVHSSGSPAHSRSSVGSPRDAKYGEMPPTLQSSLMPRYEREYFRVDQLMLCI